MAIRQKELAEFNTEEKDLLQSIRALKSVITVLAKHLGGALVQLAAGHLKSIAAINYQLQKWEGVLKHSERKALAAFVQNPELCSRRRRATRHNLARSSEFSSR